MKHKLTYEMLVEWISNKTNRSVNQTKFLFELVDRDFNKLKLLEMQLKNNFCFYCPSDKEEIEKVMKLESKRILLNF